MIIEFACIRNFKGIEFKKLDFKPGFNLIVGINGKGKTSILEAVAVGLGGFIGGVHGVSTRHFSDDEIRQEYKRTGDASCTSVTYIPAEVTICADFNGESYEWTRSRNSMGASRTTTFPRNIVRLAEILTSEDGHELPIMVYESAARIWAQKREKINDPFKNKYIRSIGYLDALVDASNIKMIRSWCLKMEMAAFKSKQEIKEYEAVKKTVALFMALLNNATVEEYTVFFDVQLEEIMFEHDGIILPVSSLSAGYQSLVWMVFNIAYRMALLNPQFGDDISNTNGVVLIDELDMHLHPSWQWNVIDALKNVFPNVQFIATTHAPILFASAKDVNVIDIDGDVSYRDSQYGIDVNLAIELFQRTSEYPIFVKKSLDIIDDALDKNEIRKAESELANLQRVLDVDNPVLTKVAARIELQKLEWDEL